MCIRDRYWIDRGQQAQQAGDHDAALHAFEHAREIDPSPSNLAHVGEEAAALGAWSRAESALATALASRDDPYVEANREHLDALLERARREHPVEHAALS